MVYQYTKLAELEAGKNGVNVFGVVKYVRPPVQNKNSPEYNALYTLIDPSVTDLNTGGIRCTLFGFKKEDLPKAEIGDIIRFHRIKVTTFNGKVQIQCRKREYAWLVYGVENFDVDTYISSHPNPTITDDDKERVLELYDFFSHVKDNISELSTQDTCLSDVRLESYFNCKVKVISIHIFEENNKSACVLRISDGTKVLYSSFRHEGVISDNNHNVSNCDYIFELSLFDDHLADVKKLKAGDFVEITNVHAKKIGNDVAAQLKDSLGLLEITDSQGWIELVVHTGKQYGRGVKVLSRNTLNLKKIEEMERRIFQIPQPKDKPVDESHQILPHCTSLQQSFTKTDFPLRPITDIQAIHKSPVPYKFKIKAWIVAVNPSILKKFIVGVCRSCSFVEADIYFPLQDSSSVQHVSSTQCPNCKKDILNLIYNFKLLVMDATGLLEINVHGDNGLHFLNNIRPSQFLEDNHIFTNIFSKFCNMAGNVGDDGTNLTAHSELPIIDLCVYSYARNGKTKYNLFGTSLI